MTIPTADGEVNPGPLRQRQLLASYATGAFALAVNAQVSFLVPLRAHELGAGFSVIGLIAGMASVGSAICAVPLGSLIDRLGARRSFMLGTAATAFLSSLLMLVTNYWWFLLLQPAWGVAQTLGWVSSQSYISSIGTPEQRPRLTGRFSFFVNIAKMASPLLVGGLAQLVGIRWALSTPAVYAACFMMLGITLAETGRRVDPTPQKRQNSAHTAWHMLAVRGIQLALLLTFARLWINVTYDTMLPTFLVAKGFTTGVAGTIVAGGSLVAAAMSPTAGYWARRFSPQAVIIAGLSSGSAALVVLPHVAVMPVVYVVPLLAGIGFGLSLPLLITIIAASVPRENLGVALGLRTTANKLAASAAPFAVGPLIEVLGMTLGFTAGGAIGAVILITSALMRVQSPSRDGQRKAVDATCCGTDGVSAARDSLN